MSIPVIRNHPFESKAEIQPYFVVANRQKSLFIMSDAIANCCGGSLASRLAMLEVSFFPVLLSNRPKRSSLLEINNSWMEVISFACIDRQAYPLWIVSPKGR